MRNKDYRELQLSSSILIFIFLSIIILGIIIFLLGVSVGKKQAQLADQSQLTPAETFEQVVADKPKPVEKVKDEISDEIAGHEEVQKQEEVKKPEVKPTPPPQTQTKPAAKNLFYLQVGAYMDRNAANATAERYRNLGFVSLVVDPSPTASRQLFRVRIGGYRTRAEAEQAKAQLVKTEGPQASEFFIVRY